MNREFFMAYSDKGFGAALVKYENKEEAVKHAQTMAERSGEEAYVVKAVVTISPKDITERVKSYEDACKVLGVKPIKRKRGFTKDEMAYYKLKIIAKALNEGWEPNWSDGNEYKYYPWFTYHGATAGFAYANTSYAATSPSASFGSRLCFKTRDLATYAGQNFLSIYNDFLLIK